MSFQIVQKKGYFLLSFSEFSDKKKIDATYKALLKEENFSKDSHTIWDFRNSIVNLSINDINQIAESVTSSSNLRSDKARSAFLVTEPTDTTVLQTYVTATSHYPVEFKIFRDYELGIKWLLE